MLDKEEARELGLTLAEAVVTLKEFIDN